MRAFSRGALACALVALAAGTPAAAQTPQLTPPQSSVVVVLDASKAMRGKQLAAAKRAVAAARRALPHGTPVAVIVRSRASCPGRAARGLPSAGDRTIVLVAAAADDCTTPPPCRSLTLGSAEPPARVDAIGLAVDPGARRQLQCAAQFTGGVYRDAASATAFEHELRTMLERATRDRRPLGHELAGGLRQSEATSTRPGEYTDAIDPDSERWYAIDVPSRDTLSVAATLAAPPAGDVSAVGSSLELQLLDPSLKAAGTATATNLFAYQPDRNLTLDSSVTNSRPGIYRVHVALRDSPDKQLETKLGGRALPLELVFEVNPPVAAAPPPPSTKAPKAADVSWPAAAGAALGCGLLVLAGVAFLPRRKVQSAEDQP
jgi:hypothetical protein